MAGPGQLFMTSEAGCPDYAPGIRVSSRSKDSLFIRERKINDSFGMLSTKGSAVAPGPRFPCLSDGDRRVCCRHHRAVARRCCVPGR